MRFDKGNCRKKRVFSQPDVPALGEVANFGIDYFLSKIKFLAKCKRVFTTKFAILPNGCVCPAYAGHTPKAFQIVQKYKFSFTNQVFGVLFFQRVQVPYERIETPNR